MDAIVECEYTIILAFISSEDRLLATWRVAKATFAFVLTRHGRGLMFSPICSTERRVRDRDSRRITLQQRETISKW